MEIEHLKHLKYKAKYNEAKKEISMLKGGIQFNPDISNMFKSACQSVFVLNGKVLNNDCRAVILALIDEFNLCVKDRKPIHNICISQGISIDGDKTTHICLRYCPELECIEFNCCREIEKNVYRRDKIDRYIINLDKIDDNKIKMYVDDDYVSEIVKKKSDLKADAVSKFINKNISDTKNPEIAKESTKQVKEMIKVVNEKVNETINNTVDQSKLFKKEEQSIYKNVVEEIKKIPELSGKDITINSNINNTNKTGLDLKPPKGIINIGQKVKDIGIGIGLNKFMETSQSSKPIELSNIIEGTENIVKDSIGTVSNVIKNTSNTVANTITGMTNLINNFVQQGTDDIEKIAVGTTNAISTVSKGDVKEGIDKIGKVVEGTVTNAMNLVGDTTSSMIEIGKDAFENIENTGKTTVKDIQKTLNLNDNTNNQTGGNRIGSFICKFDV